MWQPLNDCGKQLTIHSKLRERLDNGYKIYDITEVEFDQYHLELVTVNEQPPEEKRHNVLNCSQLVQYHFEVEIGS